MNVKTGTELDITYDREIGEKCVKAFNEFKKKFNIFPNIVYLTSEDYLSLYLHTFFSWTRTLNKPHVLEKYCGCEIRIIFNDGTYKAPKMAYETKKTNEGED